MKGSPGSFCKKLTYQVLVFNDNGVMTMKENIQKQQTMRMEGKR